MNQLGRSTSASGGAAIARNSSSGIRMAAATLEMPNTNREASSWPSAIPGPGSTMPPTMMMSQPAFTCASSMPPESQRSSVHAWNASSMPKLTHQSTFPSGGEYGATPPATSDMPTGSAPQK